MKSLFSFFTILLASTTLLVSGMDVAEAKRLGGGKSFGSKFSFSQPLKKNSMNKNSAQNQLASPAKQQNTARKQQLAQRGGVMGMLGALALGGVLGALFMGGAFEGINFMDILIIGLIIFLLFKFMSRRSQQQPAMAGGYGPTDLGDADNQQQRQTASDQFGGHNNADEGNSIDSLRSATSKQFDQEAFIEGAKNCFSRLQQAWNEGDLSDIRQFTTDHVFAEIQDQYQAGESHGKTEIVSLDAELLSSNDLGSKQEAIVLFRAELTEDDTSHCIEEVWHFIKPANSQQTTWFLDGIQQVQG